jgi:putative FmdB family regulatory protein
MPIFEYNCEHCNDKFDELVIRQDAQVNCPLCMSSS